MYKIHWKNEWHIILGIASMFAVGIFGYHHFPDRIPMHWNIHFQIDSSAAKSHLITLMYPILAAVLWFLMLYVPYLDPRRERYEQFDKSYRVIRTSVISIPFVIQWGIFLNAEREIISVPILLFMTFCILFVVMGNVMGKIRQNYFVGYKLPWTLNDADNWNKTHRFAGRTLVISGILNFLSLLLLKNYFVYIFIVSIITAAVLPILFSYRLYRQTKSQGKVSS